MLHLRVAKLGIPLTRITVNTERITDGTLLSGMTYSKMRDGFQAGASASGIVCAMEGACVPWPEDIMASDCKSWESFLLSIGPSEMGGERG